MNASAPTHSSVIGYVLWIFGFTGSLIGWFIDLFLIPSMARKADQRYVSGRIDYSVAWILLTFLGMFGVHRFYLGKIGTGILYLLTLGLLGIGIIYDFWTLNSQISELNWSKQAR